jgi:hypothetical protein
VSSDDQDASCPCTNINFVFYYTHFGSVMDTRRHIMGLSVCYTAKSCITGPKFYVYSSSSFFHKDGPGRRQTRKKKTPIVRLDPFSALRSSICHSRSKNNIFQSRESFSNAPFMYGSVCSILVFDNFDWSCTMEQVHGPIPPRNATVSEGLNGLVQWQHVQPGLFQCISFTNCCECVGFEKKKI